jgi:hypothetical protein
MIRAVFHDGQIEPLEPVPPEWVNGQEFVLDDRVDAGNGKTGDDRLDSWVRELEAAASQIDPEDDERFQHAVDQVRKDAKEAARREMGLS